MRSNHPEITKAMQTKNNREYVAWVIENTVKCECGHYFYNKADHVEKCPKCDRVL
jgi:Zn finger protein HypA/HybF involved in hydrogenase expression